MGLLASIIPVLGNIFGKVIDSAFPDPADKLKADQLKQNLQIAILNAGTDLEKAANENVKAEIQGTSWLQKNWRPLCMLTFMALIVARWFGYTAPNMSSAEALELWSIVKIGLGGYTIGRSAEKIAPSVIKAIAK